MKSGRRSGGLLIYSQATPICSFYTLKVEKALVKEANAKLKETQTIHLFIHGAPLPFSASLDFNPYILYDIIFIALYAALLIYDHTYLFDDVFVSDRLAQVFWAQQSLEFTQIKEVHMKGMTSPEAYRKVTLTQISTLWHHGEQKRISKSSDAEETSDSTSVCKKQEPEATAVTGPAKLYSWRLFKRTRNDLLWCFVFTAVQVLKRMLSV